MRPRSALAALAVDDIAGIGLTGQMHGLVALDADERVLRPAILWNDQRTGAECREIEERLGLPRLLELTGNRALPGFTAPKLLWLRSQRARDLRADRARPPAEGLRSARADRRARDRRRGRLRDAALRRRRPPLERRGARRPRAPGRLAASGARVARRGRPRPRPASRSRRAQATRLPARSAWESRRRGPSRSCSGTSGVVVRRSSGSRRRPGGAGARLLPRRPGHLARDGRDAFRGRARSAGFGTRSRRASRTSCWSPRPKAGSPAPKGSSSSPTWRASARRTSTRRRAGRSPGSRCGTTAARSSRAVLEGVAYGLRDSLEVLRSLGCRLESAVCPAAARAAASGSRSSPPCSGCRWSGRWSRRVRPTARLSSAASRAACSRTSTRRWPHACASATRSSPTPPGSSVYAEGYGRYRSLYPALDPWRRMSTKWGIISTANINRLVLAGAGESDQVDVVAVASRDQARAEAYAREHGIERAYGSYEALLADPDIDAVYISLPELAARRVVDPLARGRQARPLREAARQAPRGGRARLRRRRAGGSDPHGGVHVPPQPADGEGEGARGGRRRSGTLRFVRAAFSFGLGRPRERPPRRRPGRGRPHGRRLLLRQRVAPARRRAARRSTARSSSARAASTSSSPGRCASRATSSRQFDCGFVLPGPRRARDRGRRGVALPRRPLARAHAR